MKIFISWSGEQSKAVAVLLKPWLQKVLQATSPWMSAEDITPGTRWAERIARELAVTEFGILCVTAANKKSEWLNFEAGALSIAIGDTDRLVVPLLIGFQERGDVGSGPLSTLNTLVFNETDMFRLVETINEQLNPRVETQHLREVFNAFWPKLDEDVRAIDVEQAPKTPAKDHTAYLEDILSYVKDISRQQSEARPVHVQAVRDDFEQGYGRLTIREQVIVDMIMLGHTNREIAQELTISNRTLEGHIYRIFTKLGVTKREELTELLSARGLSEDPGPDPSNGRD